MRRQSVRTAFVDALPVEEAARRRSRFGTRGRSAPRCWDQTRPLGPLLVLWRAAGSVVAGVVLVLGAWRRWLETQVGARWLPKLIATGMTELMLSPSRL